MRLPGTIKALGVVSLLTDLSSEMIYPLLPAFVTGALGAGPAILGVIEGVAEATAALVKLASGRLSDRLGRRKPLVVLGYALSSVARPLVAVAATAGQVLAIRIADRFGKGVRGAPRDALAAAVVAPGERGRAFGFHRAMDHAGALLGPLVATALLAAGLPLRTVFALAVVPALASVAVLVLAVRERRPEPQPAGSDPPFAGGELSHGLRTYLAVLAVFTLGNSSDAFLLLRAQESGVPLAGIPLLWAFHHAVKSLASTHGGILSDRLGRRPAIAGGFLVYSAAYAGFAVATQAVHVVLLFAVYGLHHALTEGPERALVADLAGTGVRGRAFGAYHAVTGAMLLPASLLTGWLWQAWGAATALAVGAGLSAFAAIGLLAAGRIESPGL